MTETSRTTITLTKSVMRLVDEIINVFGATRAQVISNIVEFFFNNKKNDQLLDKLRTRKREQNKPDDEILDKKIKDLLDGANNIPLDFVLKYLNIGETYFIIRNKKWSNKYNYKLDNNRIVKNE